MKNTKVNKPTESELDILAILWEKQSATVREVHEMITLHKEAGYTTTLKLMQIMFEKELVTRDSSHKTHVYSPAVSKEKTQKQFMTRMINSLFSGSSTQLVLQALGNKDASEKELLEIEFLIQELKKKK